MIFEIELDCYKQDLDFGDFISRLKSGDDYSITFGDWLELEWTTFTTNKENVIIE